MLNWLRNILPWTKASRKRQFYSTLDSLNANAHGGKPVTIQKLLGNLKLHSGTICLGDPQYVRDLVISHIPTNKAAIAGTLWQYPSGGETVVALTVTFNSTKAVESHRVVGQVGIDSAAMVIVDRADVDAHWTETGRDRIGVVTTPKNDLVLRRIRKKFKLRAVKVNPIRWEILGPISEKLEQEIVEYLKTYPEYEKYPFMFFNVQTNNSFDRANFMKEPWAFMPVGNADEPLMFVSGTGRGDGCYDVVGGFAGNDLVELSIDFLAYSGIE